VSDLASHLGVTLPTASVAVAKLTARGLLATPGQGERRKLLLTPAGADLVERARADATAAFERRLEQLAPTTLQQIDDALRALEAALGGASRRHVGVASHASQTRSDQPAAREVDTAVCSTELPLDPA
jgi:deoxyinosine 3'endonuclease (endonuclease V)